MEVVISVVEAQAATLFATRLLNIWLFTWSTRNGALRGNAKVEPLRRQSSQNKARPSCECASGDVPRMQTREIQEGAYGIF